MRPRLLDHHRRLILVNFSVLFGFWSSQGTTQLQLAEAGAQQTSCCCSAMVLVLVLLQLGMKQGIKSRQCKVCGWRLFLDWITFNPVSYASVLYPLVWCLTCCVGSTGRPPRLAKPIIFIPLWQGPKLPMNSWDPAKKKSLQSSASIHTHTSMMSQNGLFTMEKWHKEATLKQYGLLLSSALNSKS